MNNRDRSGVEEEIYVSSAPRITKQLADALDETGLKWRDIPGVGDMYEFFKWENHDALIKLAEIITSDKSNEIKFQAIGRLFRLFKVEPNIGWETQTGVVCIRKNLYLYSDSWQLILTRDIEGKEVLAKGFITAEDYLAICKFSQDPEWEVFCVFLADVYSLLSKYEEWGEDGSEFSECATAAFYNSGFGTFVTLDRPISEREELGLVAIYQKRMQEGTLYVETEQFHGFEENVGTSTARVKVSGKLEEKWNFRRVISYDSNLKFFALHENTVDADFEKLQSADNPFHLSGMMYKLAGTKSNLENNSDTSSEENKKHWLKYARVMGFSMLILHLNAHGIRNYAKGFGRNYKYEEQITRLLKRRPECAVDSKTGIMSLTDADSAKNPYLAELRERTAKPVNTLYSTTNQELKSAQEVWDWVNQVVR